MGATSLGDSLVFVEFEVVSDSGVESLGGLLTRSFNLEVALGVTSATRLSALVDPVLVLWQSRVGIEEPGGVTTRRNSGTRCREIFLRIPSNRSTWNLGSYPTRTGALSRRLGGQSRRVRSFVVQIGRKKRWMRDRKNR